MWPATGASVKRWKSGAACWPSRSVTSFASQSGRISPAKVPATSPGKSDSVVGTRCSWPTQNGAMSALSWTVGAGWASVRPPSASGYPASQNCCGT